MSVKCSKVIQRLFQHYTFSKEDLRTVLHWPSLQSLLAAPSIYMAHQGTHHRGCPLAVSFDRFVAISLHHVPLINKILHTSSLRGPHKVAGQLSNCAEEQTERGQFPHYKQPLMLHLRLSLVQISLDLHARCPGKRGFPLVQNKQMGESQAYIPV